MVLTCNFWHKQKLCNCSELSCLQVLTYSSQNNNKRFFFFVLWALLLFNCCGEKEQNCLHNTVVLSNPKFVCRIHGYIMHFAKCLSKLKVSAICFLLLGNAQLTRTHTFLHSTKNTYVYKYVLHMCCLLSERKTERKMIHVNIHCAFEGFVYAGKVKFNTF